MSKRLITSMLWSVFLVMFSGCTKKLARTSKRVPLIKVQSDGKIESLDLETYVASVLAGEILPSWPMETLKAQAVAARTFALLRMNERKGRPYHLRNSIMDQVSKAKPSEKFIRAARETTGLVLVIDGHLAETSFHSTCGGKTTDALAVWGRAHPHLEGVSCGYCRSSPTYRWQIDVPHSLLKQKFSQNIRQIKILSHTKDGRAKTLRLIADKSKDISAHSFRMSIGPMKLKSTYFSDVHMTANGLRISGFGFGHGVGLCQYGAMGMAKNGHNFAQILQHYYPKTVLKRVY